MNTPIDIALTKIRHSIPYEILEYAFQKRDSFEAIATIDNLILERIIRGRVKLDMDVYGGRIKDIMLRHEYLEHMDRTIDDNRMCTGRYSLYRIPPEARDDLPITEVTNIKIWGSYAHAAPANFASIYGANMMTQANAVLDSHTFASQCPRPTVELLSGDLVKLHPSMHSAGMYWILCCRLAFDDCFTNLNTSAMEPFADLCLYATQAYIFNTCAVPLDRAYIAGGYAIGVFKSIIDSYAEANQKYNETLDQLAGAMFLAPDRLNEILPYII